MSNDPIELLKEVYTKVDNGNRALIKQAADAVKEMRNELDDLRGSIMRQPLPEAPVSGTVKMIDPATQMEWLLTFRYHGEDELIGGIARLSKKIGDAGLIGFDAYVDQRRAERGQQEQPHKLPSGPQALPVRQQDNGGATFQAKTLAATVNDGKTYWKVKGGKFEKFGITVWPEVLEEAGFFTDNLDPMTVYDISSYTATYSIKDGGKPDKVTKLAKQEKPKTGKEKP